MTRRPMKPTRAILLVEDNPDDVEITRRALREGAASVELIVARDGQEALDYLLRQGPHAGDAAWRLPDLVLLDLNLAYPDGLDVLRQVRGNEATRRTPIVLVSGGSLQLSSEESDLVDSVVQKPFDIDIMLNAVRKALGDPVVEVQPRHYDAQDYFLHGY